VQALTADGLLKPRSGKTIGELLNAFCSYSRLRLYEEFLTLPAVLAIRSRFLATPGLKKIARRLPPECEMVFGKFQLLFLLWRFSLP
jgi:hypothetical protein